MKIHGTAKGGALSKKDFGVAFSTATATENWQDIYSDESAWTTVKSGTTPTVTFTESDDPNGLIKIDGASINPDPSKCGVYQSTSPNISQYGDETKFKINFEIKRNTTDGADQDVYGFSSYNFHLSGGASSDEKYLRMNWENGSDWSTRYQAYDPDGSLSSVDGALTTLPSANSAINYCTWVGDGSTIDLKVYSDSDRTTLTQSDSTAFPTGWTNTKVLDFMIVSCNNNAGGAWHYQVGTVTIDWDT